MDFTLKKYRQLLEVLLASGYRFQTYKDFILNPDEGKVIVLRHDVDLKPKNSLDTAMLEKELGIQATYYFRAVPESWDETIIKDIASMGHEVGYHYESLTTCHGNIDAAYQDFCTNLTNLRQLLSTADNGRTFPLLLEGVAEGRGSDVNITAKQYKMSQPLTICMHGSPRSPYDSKDIWKKYSYKDLGIIAEPYLDTNWSKTFYLTDTGRRWDGFNVSVRDKIPEYQDQWTKAGFVFHSTDDIIKALRTPAYTPSAQNSTFHTPHSTLRKLALSFSPPCSAKTNKFAFALALLPRFARFFPPRSTELKQVWFSVRSFVKSFVDSTLFSPHAHIMITTHPQRWTDKPIPWIKELLLQNLKNGVKKLRS